MEKYLPVTIGENGFPEGINAVIFLLHKPVGQGRREIMISKENKLFRELCKIVDNNKLPYKIGFDSCTVPTLLKLKNIKLEYLDTCEAARWSAYISADMKMMPCSFAHTTDELSVSLKDHSIEEVWNSAEFDSFRNKFKVSCPECKKRDICLGGCPILPEIVLCEDKKNE